MANEDARVNIGTQLDTSGAEKGAKSLGNKLNKLGSFGAKAFKGTAIAVGATATAVGGLVTKSVQAYAQYEQLVGGVETMFGAGGKSLQQYAKSIGKTADEAKGEYTKLINAQETVLKNADNAFRTAGLSANEYMETVTSFSASLVQSLGGDTEKAAGYADRAITDMSDNANKMGTSMEMIQNAYQGFAKQNYTMLDNLKLGYGGTKTEMQRLIQDASKLTDVQKELGVTVDANDMSFGNIVNAISVMQSKLGIMGTTEKEALETIEGSLNMTKSAWDNLIAGMSKDDVDFNTLIDNFITSFSALEKNLVPRVEQALNGVGRAMTTLLPTILEQVMSAIIEFGPKLIQAGVQMLTSIGKGMTSALPKLTQGIQLIGTAIQNGVTSLFKSFPTLVEGLLSSVFDIADQIFTKINTVFANIVEQLAPSLSEAFPEFIDMILTNIDSLVESIASNVGTFVDTGIQLLLGLAQGIANSIPVLIEKIPTIISNIANIINDNAPKLITTGVKIIVTLATGLIKAIPTLVANIPKILKAMWDAFMAFNWLKLGKTIITSLGKGIKSMASSIKSKAGDIKDGIKDKISELPSALKKLGRKAISHLKEGIGSMKSKAVAKIREIGQGIKDKIGEVPGEMLSIGTNIVKGIWNGISNAKEWVLSKIKGFGSSIVDGLKSIFKIHSPSRVMRDVIGKNIVLGIAQGITKNGTKAIKASSDLSQKLLDKMKTRLEHYQVFHETTEEEEIAFWRKMTKLTKKYSNAWWEAQSNLQSLLKKQKEDFKSNRKEILDNYKSSGEEILTTLENTLNQLTEEYENTYKSKVEEIKNSLGSLFDMFKIAHTKNTTDTLKEHLQSQVDALKEYQSALNSLKNRDVPTEMFEEISALGISSTEDIQVLASMTDKELQEYIALWEEKNKVASDMATSQLEYYKKSIDEQMEDARTQAIEQLDKLQKDTNKKLKKIGSTTKVQGKNIGTSLVDGIIAGIQAKQSALQAALTALANTTTKTTKKKLKVNSPSKEFIWIGQMCVDGLMKPFNDLESQGGFIQNALGASGLQLGSGFNFGNSGTTTTINQTINVNKEVSTPDDIARALRLEARYGLIGG